MPANNGDSLHEELGAEVLLITDRELNSMKNRTIDLTGGPLPLLFISLGSLDV